MVVLGCTTLVADRCTSLVSLAFVGRADVEHVVVGMAAIVEFAIDTKEVLNL